MALQIYLEAYSKILYLIFLELNQPFTFDECLVAVQSLYPACTKKVLHFRIKEMVKKKYLKKQRIKRKTFYKCLVSKTFILTLPASSVSSNHKNHLLLCEL